MWPFFQAGTLVALINSMKTIKENRDENHKNLLLLKAAELAENLIRLGYEADCREDGDSRSGVFFGIVKDCGYKIKTEAYKEIKRCQTEVSNEKPDGGAK